MINTDNTPPNKLSENARRNRRRDLSKATRHPKHYAPHTLFLAQIISARSLDNRPLPCITRKQTPKLPHPPHPPPQIQHRTRGAYQDTIQFPDIVLTSLEPDHDYPSAWNGTLKLHSSPESFPAHPTKLALHFGTRRTSILSPQGARHTPPLNTTSRPNQR